MWRRPAGDHWMNAPHYILTEAYTAAQTIGILSRMKVVTSMRLHGLIFAAGQGVPLVGIVYDQKGQFLPLLHWAGPLRRSKPPDRRQAEVSD